MMCVYLSTPNFCFILLIYCIKSNMIFIHGCVLVQYPDTSIFFQVKYYMTIEYDNIVSDYGQESDN